MKYTLKHEIFNLSDPIRINTSCNGITFTNTGASAVLLKVNNSAATLAAGASLAFNSNHPDVVITTIVDVIPAAIGGPVSVLVIKEIIENAG